MGEVNNYVKYISEGDKDEKLSFGEYLNMMHLRNLIKRHKPIERLSNNNSDTDTDRAEWKFMLRMHIKGISTLKTLLQNFQLIQETSNKRESKFIPDSVELLEYELHKINIIGAELYIPYPDWIASKKATINPKNEKDNKCFQWSILTGVNYNIIKEKELKKLLNFKRVDIDLSSHQRYWENFEQENNSIAINVIFGSHKSEEINLAYK